MSAFAQMRKLSFASLATLSLMATGTAMAQAMPTEESISTASPAADPVTLDLVGINDFHGRIAADRDSAGAAVLAGAVDQLRAENENTLFVSAGDNIGASTFASASQEDAPTIDALGAAGLDVSVVGNHEFDKGFEDLATRVTERFAAATGQSGEDFALGANVYQAGTKTPALKEYAIREAGGLSVGFIGTVTEDVPSLVSPSGISGLDFGSEVEAANRVAKQLSDGDEANGEADVIVLLTHNGSANTDCAAVAGEATSYGDLIREASGEIDAIFSGHTHSSYNCDIAGPDGERPVIQSHQYGTTLGKVSLDVDPATGEVLQSSSTRLPLASKSADGDWTANYEANPAVAKIVAEAEKEAEVVGSVKVGEISEDILRGGDVPGEDRGVESALGNTVADVHLWATSNDDFAGEPAQIAFMNPGGLRSDLLYGEDGTVTYQEAAEVQPFANTLITFNLTGAQIREALEQQWQPEGSERNKLHLGISEGLAYTYIEDAPAGEHIQKITFNGEPLDESATFRVAANAFLATGGDNFTAFAEGTDHADSGQVDLDATVNFFKAHDVVSPSPLGRAVLAGTDWATVVLDATEVKAGETVNVTVSDLEEGAQISASAFEGATKVADIPAADASGTTAFQLPVGSSVEPGDYQLVVSQVQHEDIAVDFAVVAQAQEPTPSPSDDPQPTPSPTEDDNSETESPAPTTDSDPSAEPTSDSEEDSSDDSKQQDSQDLADTGFSASWVGIAAGIVVLVGIVLLLIRRFGNKAGR
ncbi:bifunctional metallophosphatase/5'-nucleotidase [Glutamicibacter halophytocola]|uniref:bifunctional metallophosphatase/5'-nucleotidase n=1 Tax=Glutamicibacter halophytocola TaxID=1933880 RepID=UPI000A076AAD|nr:bifunctional UDP-sugar hydrolase/5'-nucleotidase [Glutamicibacter halophytocola]